MRQRSLIRITAMRNMRIDSGQMFASIGVEVVGRDIAAVTADLAALPDAGFVASVLGRYHILVMGLLGSAQELSDLLTRRIERLQRTHEQLCRLVATRSQDPPHPAIPTLLVGDTGITCIARGASYIAVALAPSSARRRHPCADVRVVRMRWTDLSRSCNIYHIMIYIGSGRRFMGTDHD